MLEDRLASDFKEAMKSRDQVRTQSLSFLRSELKNVAIDKRKDKLDDADVIGVIKKLIKQRQDGILQFEKGQRMDLVAKEKAELELLKAYLPAEMSEGQLIALVDEVVTSIGATSVKDMGRVIKEVVARAGGQADGKTVSDLVKKKLSAG
jgi:uncharacterized protein YqeY